MAVRAGTAFIDVEAKLDSLNKNVNAAAQRVGKEAGQKLSKNLSTSIKGSLGTALKGATLFAGAGLALKAKDFLGGAIKEASSLGEAVNKVNVVFGESSDEVLAFGKNALKTIGQSERSALSAAGVFGNLAVSFGIGTGKAAEMATTLTGLASDLASFNDTSIEEALNALRSGLSGETEPLKRFGVALNETELRQKALELGLVSTTKEVLPAAIKAQAAYAFILDKTKTAQGDYANTQDSFANASRRFSQTVDQLQAQLGKGLVLAFEKLIPLGEALVFGIGALVNVVGDIPEPIKALGLAILGLKLAQFISHLGFVQTALTVMRARFAALVATWLAGNLTIGALTARLGTLIASALNPANLAFAAAALTAYALFKAFQSGRERTKKLATDAKTLAQAIKDVGGANKKAAFEAALTTINENKLGGALRKAGVETETQIKALLGNAGAQDKVRKALKVLEDQLVVARVETGNYDESLGRLTDAQKNQAVTDIEGTVKRRDAILSLFDLAGATREAEAAIERDTKAVDTLAGKTDGLTRSTKGIGREFKLAAESADNFRGVIERAIGVNLDLEEAQDALVKATRELGETVDANGRDFVSNSEKALENRAALRDMVRAAEDVIDAQTRTGDGTRYTTGQLNKFLEQLGSVRDDVPGTASKLNPLIDKLKDLRTPTNVKIGADTKEGMTKLEKFRLKLTEVQRAGFDKIIRANVTLGVATTSGTATPRVTDGAVHVKVVGAEGRHGGGPISAGHAYVTGERGPELVIPDHSGTVLPNGAGIAGSAVYEININADTIIGSSKKEIAEALGPYIRDALLKMKSRTGTLGIA